MGLSRSRVHPLLQEHDASASIIWLSHLWQPMSPSTGEATGGSVCSPAHPPAPSSRRSGDLPLLSRLAGAVRRKNHRSFRSMTMKKNGHANATVDRTTATTEKSTTATTEKNGHANATVGRTPATMKKN